MNNAAYRKKMENIRNIIDVGLISNEKGRNQTVCSKNYFTII